MLTLLLKLFSKIYKIAGSWLGFFGVVVDVTCMSVLQCTLGLRRDYKFYVFIDLMQLHRIIINIMNRHVHLHDTWI